MAITRTIGKNTLGDNNKMHVRLREYDMSSQNLSLYSGSTMGVGMLVPFMKIVGQRVISSTLVDKQNNDASNAGTIVLKLQTATLHLHSRIQTVQQLVTQ